MLFAAVLIANLASGQISVTSPNGSERLVVGTTHTITWTASSSITQVRIEYSSNGGNTWSLFQASTANDENEPWVVPNIPSAFCIVRVSDALNVSMSDTSDGMFRVEPAGSWPFIVTKTSGEVILSYLPVGSASANSEIGFGYATETTPASYRHILYQDVPNNPLATPDHSLGFLPAGSALDFYVITLGHSAYSGNRPNESFSDTNNDSGFPDPRTAVTVLPNEAEGYLMHLDRCYGGSDDDNDFFIEVRVVAMTESPPVAVVQTPSGVQRGPVTVIYMLKDTQSDPCTIFVQFSQDGGLTWQFATQGPGGDGISNLTSSPTGLNHVFVWDSLTDIGQTRQSDIRICITPADANDGTPGETGNFTVDNVPPPVLSCSPDLFVFDAMEGGANPPVSILKVWNSGGDILNWQVADDATWLTLTPPTGQSTGEEDSVNVSVSVAGLVPGTYAATITVSSTQLPSNSILVPVTLTVVEMVPILSVSPSSMIFLGWEGGPNPLPQSLQIQNIGGHPMAWQVVSTMPWLKLSPESGSSEWEIDPVEVSVDLTGLMIGEYVAHITVIAAASNSPKDVPVLLEVTEPPPILSVSPGLLTFSATEGEINVSPQAIQIRNAGTGEFSWSISDDAEWLSASPTTGTNAGETDAVMVRVDIAGLTVGAYNAALTVTADAVGSPQHVDVTLTVLPKPPALSVSPTVLHFAAVEGKADPASQSITVKNAGSGEMDWHASADMPWLKMLPQDGTSSGEEDAADVSVAVTGLVAGSYAGRITFTSANAVNSPVEVPVLLDVAEPPPLLAVTPPSLTFTCVEGEENPAPQEIEVRNAGGGQLDWQATSDSTWVSLSAVSGSLSAGAAKKVQIEVDASGLTARTYTATLTLTGTGDSTLQTVLMTLIVQEPPPASLEVSPLTLEFYAKEGDGNPAPQEINIRNAGGRELAWHVFSDSNWLKCSPDSGNSRGDVDLVTVSVEVSELDPGVHSGTLTVTAPGADNSPQLIQMTLTFEGLRRVLEVSPTRLDFEREAESPDPAPQSFTVRNAGEGEMLWQTSVDEPWVRLSPQSGTNTGVAESIRVSIESQGLAPGSYTANVTVHAGSAENSPQSISIGLVIRENPPVLEVSPSALSFEMDEEGPAPYPKTFAIRNVGGRTMDWQVSADQQWVRLTPASGVNTGVAQFVQVSISASGTAPGNYTSTVTVNAPGAVNSPQTISIRLTIKMVIPEIRVSPQVLEFTTRRGGPNPADQQFSIVISPKGVTWVATESEYWLSLTPSTGTNSGEADAVTVSVNKAALDLGTYETDIVVRDAQKPTFTASVHVILRVQPIRVPEDYPTIHEGIAAAQERDVILVSAGTYGEKIRMKDAIEVIGEGADRTVIDCENRGTTVVFEGLDWAKLEGFTITRGTGERFGKGAEIGGGIYISQSSPLISRCRILNNSAVWGGGVCLDAGAFPEFIDCEVSGNSAVIGGGFFCYEGAAGNVSTSRISGNVAEWYGGAVCLTQGSSMELAGCLIHRNSSSYDSAGISGTAGSDVSLVSCTITDNEAPEGAALFMESSSRLKADNSIIWGNASPMILEGTHSFRNCNLEDSGFVQGVGNISADPRFADSAKGDYHLLPSSPCLDAGWNEATGLPQSDLDGEARVMAGPVGMITDIGADELDPDVPIVLLNGVSPQEGGWVQVSYTLYHLWDTPCSVCVEYSLAVASGQAKNGGVDWQRATRAATGDGTFELSTSREGEAHTFFWDSIADEGGASIQNVLVRVTAVDGAGGGVGGPFALNNREADKDNDRLPDSWEQLVANANPDDDILSPADVLAGDDFDGDGSSNRAEYLMGTNPTDSRSCLRLRCAHGVDSETVLSWPSVKGKVYRLLYTRGLQNGWHVLTPPASGTGDWLEYRDLTAANEPLRFYRLEAE